MARGRPFQKGQSGNPSGRPKGSAGFAEAIRTATKGGRKLYDFALDVLDAKVTSTVVTKDGEAIAVPPTIKDRMDAVKWLGDRGFGKSPDAVPDEDGADDAKDAPPQGLFAVPPPEDA